VSYYAKNNNVHTDNFFNKIKFKPLLRVAVAATKVPAGLHFQGSLHTIILHASHSLHDNYIPKNGVVLTTQNIPKDAINFIFNKSELQTTSTLSRNTSLPLPSWKRSASFLTL
jgi:hypothetical protein